jgi:ATP-binding cassette subfamily B protein
LALLTPLPLKIVVDSVFGSHPLPGFLDAILPSAATDSGTVLLGIAVGLVVLVSVVSQLTQFSSQFLQTYAGQKLVLGFRTLLFGHVQRLSLAYHDSKGTPDAMYRIHRDATAIQQVAIEGVIPFVSLIFTVGAMVYVTVRIDWQLALVALAVSPFLFLLTQVYRPRIRRKWRDAMDLETSALSVVQEALSSLRVVKAFGQEDREQDRFSRRSTESIGARMRVVSAEGNFNLLIGLGTTFGSAAVLWMGAQHVLTGSLTLGELLIVMSYMGQLYEPLRTIGRRVAAIQGSLASADRAYALLNEPPDVLERPNARPILRARGAVAFRGVSFAYGEERLVLRDVTFEISPGSSVGVVGATGAGKTTIASLLTRFFDPTEGQILLDGVDLRDYRLADLRNQFAIVLQEPVLFSTSISENIAYARPNASHKEIVEAAMAANIHDFVTSLPQGYNTPVGERGMTLSGGERQRISLARAFLKDAPILILDEPTSSVDLATEAVIIEAMERLARRRTTFMITHRVDTLRHCDLVLKIDRGLSGQTTLVRARNTTDIISS